VAVVARTLEQCRRVASEIGDRATPIAADVADPKACERALAHATARLGELSVLINARHLARPPTAEEHDVQAFRRTIDVNLTARPDVPVSYPRLVG
jgi:NADP-dependent 3-hydroxy acid dehydrogenase YdfG